MRTHNKNIILESILDTIDIPPSAYEKAKQRYKDLGDWFGRTESKCSIYSPSIYPQGSFRLGTVIRPLGPNDDYDLDMGTRLMKGITKDTHTQKFLKDLVGDDLEAYRAFRQIQQKLEEMHRCWRLSYEDKLRFHLDAVPSVPQDDQSRSFIKQAVFESGSSDQLASNVAAHAGAITDNRHEDYERISRSWKVSNSEGYALWFESRMELSRVLLEKKAAEIAPIPTAERKTPLQRCIQLLKRHRDVMYARHSDYKPISIIITTLAAHAYNGEDDLAQALEGILLRMGDFVRQTTPRVPNPVNPLQEDFADKWSMPKYQHLRLEDNFWGWLSQARTDFQAIKNSIDPRFLVEQAKGRFAVEVGEETLKDKLGVGFPSFITTPKAHVISEAPARPWRA